MRACLLFLAFAACGPKVAPTGPGVEADLDLRPVGALPDVPPGAASEGEEPASDGQEPRSEGATASGAATASGPRSASGAAAAAGAAAPGSHSASVTGSTAAAGAAAPASRSASVTGSTAAAPASRPASTGSMAAAPATGSAGPGNARPGASVPAAPAADLTLAPISERADALRAVAPPGKGARTGTIARDHLIAVLDAGPGNFLRQLEVMPRRSGERFVGWQLVQLLDHSGPLTGVDLVAGDVLLGVNGNALSRPEHLKALWDSLRTANEVTARLWRGDKKLELRFTIEPRI
jgi:hypothetical protein